MSAASRLAGANRLGWALAGGACALVFTVRRFIDPDVWWHLALGDLIRRSGVPAQEPFSFLTTLPHTAAGPPHPWVGQQWLYEVVLSLLTRTGGAGLASLVMGVVAAAAFVVAVRAAPRSLPVAGPVTAAAVLLSVLVAAQVLGVRGQVVTVLGVACVLVVVQRWREGSRRAVWVIPPMLVLWANLHAGFTAGIVLLLVVAGAVAVIRRCGGDAGVGSVRLLLGATAAGSLLTALNPAGPALWPYVADTFLNPTLTQAINEWLSPDFHNWLLRLFEGEVILLMGLWALSRRPDPLDVLLAIGALLAALQAQRNVAIFAVVATPQLAVYGTLAWRRLRAGRPLAVLRRLGPLGIPVALITAVVAVVSVSPTLASAGDERAQPAAAATWLSRHVPGQHVYTLYEWGGYLAYRFPTQRMVYVYGESAIFGAAQLDRYLQVHTVLEHWRQVLAEDGDMRVAVVPARRQEWTLLSENGWTTACYDRDADAAVLLAPIGGSGTPTLPPGGPPAASTAAPCSG